MRATMQPWLVRFARARNARALYLTSLAETCRLMVATQVWLGLLYSEVPPRNVPYLRVGKLQLHLLRARYVYQWSVQVRSMLVWRRLPRFLLLVATGSGRSQSAFPAAWRQISEVADGVSTLR